MPQLTNSIASFRAQIFHGIKIQQTSNDVICYLDNTTVKAEQLKGVVVDLYLS